MIIRMVLALILLGSFATEAKAAHGGGGGGGGAKVSGGGGGEGGGEAVALKKPVNRKKEFGCYKYLLARSEMDSACRILFEATNERADTPGLKEERHEKYLARLRSALNGLRFLKMLPEAGPTTQPNWCELKRKITEVNEMMRMEKKRQEDRKAEEAAVKKKE